MTTYRRDIISSVFFGTGAIILYAYVAQYPVREGQPAAVSAGFYPKILAFALGILAVVQLVTTVVKERRARAAVHAAASETAARGESVAESDAGTAAQTAPAEVKLWKDATAFKLLMLTFVSLVVYPFLMELVGFFISGIAFLGTLIFALSRDQRRGTQRWIIIAITLGIGILTYIVFRHFLNIPFPRGIFFQR